MHLKRLDHGRHFTIAPRECELAVADFQPIKESKIGELPCNFDIVLGRTPDDNRAGSKRPR